MEAVAVPDRHPELPLDPDAADDRFPARPLHRRLGPLALVAVGGFLGALARYAVAQWRPTTSGQWPVGTLLVNLIGAFILGALLEGLARAGTDDGRRLQVRLLVGTGFCGALTTYSTLAVESDLLIRDHRTGLAVAYLMTSVVAGLVVTLAGVLAASRYRVGRPDSP
jgi:fluoride exporter